MLRIGANGLSASDLALGKALASAFLEQGRATQRLATASRINQGRDDPAGLIAAEQIRAELTALEAADRNASRAVSTIHVADSGLDQVGSLLRTIEDNVLAASGGSLSGEELAANQLEIDAALEAVNRIGQTTELGGVRLLDGSHSSLTFAFSSDPGETATVDLPHVATTSLGDGLESLKDLASSGSASLESGNFSRAMEVIAGARNQVLSARAELGSFERHTIESSREVTAGARENLASALSEIADADFASETSRLARSQILAESAANLLRFNRSDRRRSFSLLLPE